METVVWLVRHGQTEWAAHDRFNGRSDIDLTGWGREQARLLAERLQREPIKGVYTSSLKRCRETAAILAAPHGLAPIADEALVELDFGAWDGMLRQDILRQYPVAWASWVDDPATTAPPGGEAAYAALARASGALARVVAQHRGEAVIVVAHKAVNRLLLCDLLGMMPRYYRSRLGQRPCALNCIEWRDGGPMVTLVNDVSHYATQSGNQEDDNACT